MGLFDSLSSGSGGGLLDFLRSIQQQPSMGQDFGDGLIAPSQMQGMGGPMPGMAMPSITSQPLSPPSSAPPQMQNQPPQMQPQQAAQQPSPFGGNIMAGINNLNSGSNPITMLANVVNGFATGQRFDRAGIQQQNQRAMFEAYKAAGFSPEKALLATLNPEVAKALLPQISPKTEKLSPGESLVSVTGTTATPISGLPAPQAKFDDVASIRKEVGSLPEVKRYAEAAPIFASMTKSMNNPTAAADLDFVYGVAKIFDPESVVREGEMKLVGQAQSIPEGIKGMMQRVVYGGERLTPEARMRILEVANTRMKELEGATTQRLSPYPDIAKRNNMRPEDIMPLLPTLPAIPPLSSPTAPKPQSRSATGADAIAGGFKILNVR
jgi:hypothetical protein